MKYKNEAQVLKKLGLESWRNLSKEHVVRFAAMMPEMDREVALRIVEQFPQFKEFALGALDILERGLESALEKNQASQEHVHSAFRAVREILQGELGREDVGPADRMVILEMIMETARLESDKDSENKRFLESLTKVAAASVVAVVTLGLVFLGGKAALEASDLDGS